MRYFFQDGPDFYDNADGRPIASYPELVKNDHDYAGALAAETEFLRTHPTYRPLPDEEEPEPTEGKADRIGAWEYTE